jgi:hypothetical protein
MYSTTPFTPRHAHTLLRPRSHLAKVPFHVKVVAAAPRQHPPNTQQPTIQTSWPWHPNLPASSSTMAVFIDDHPSEPQRIHHCQPSARVWCLAVMYSRCSTTSPQRFVWRKVARVSSCFVVTGREVSSRTIGIAPRINKFDRIKLIVHYKYSKTSLLHKWT